ncbi:Uma2 family endonuclease [Tychonema sp. BBK16]|uniref:Uma2 family endonuclease n=1 Tax=Tychonema sp. BBK16 TaxID=2699888 RepID=UPI001F3935AC|nr:Uma2 family endonuclease [Tychonema sp. BBK16]MCF6375663.1 Uma2 family endonuclease [Tychonema sp. BBK16]
MITQLQSPEKAQIVYPDDNGESMSDNTEQFRLIVWIKENLELLFARVPDVFVAGNLLWYPVEENNKISQAPDAMVVFGRPKGYRGSYQQWNEGNIVPQVVFEIWSPGNRLTPMLQKLRFYEQYGVEEYYLYNPTNVDLTIWERRDRGLEPIEQVDGWVSPRMGVRFQVSETELQIFRPDGTPFVSFVELAQLREQAELRAEQERQRAEQERQRAEQAENLLEQERSRSQALEARLRDMGIDPNIL